MSGGFVGAVPNYGERSFAASSGTQTSNTTMTQLVLIALSILFLVVQSNALLPSTANSNADLDRSRKLVSDWKFEKLGQMTRPKINTLKSATLSMTTNDNAISIVATTTPNFGKIVAKLLGYVLAAGATAVSC